MFVYCGNNPILNIDTTGHDHIVGAGIQIDGSVGVGSFSGCGGGEVIVYWDTEESNDAGKPIVAIYGYGGGSLDISNLSKDVYNIADLLVENSAMLQGNPEKVLSGLLESVVSANASVSVSGVIVVGEEKFKSAGDYEGSFTTTSVNLWHVKGSRSQGDSCHSWSIGGTFAVKPSRIGISRSVTKYKLLWSNNMEKE